MSNFISLSHNYVDKIFKPSRWRMTNSTEERLAKKIKKQAKWEKKQRF